VKLDRRADHGGQSRGSQGESAQDRDRGRRAIGHAAEEKRGNKCGQGVGGERPHFDGPQAVGIEHGAQGHQPHAGRGALQEEERNQFRIFGPTNGFEHRVKGTRCRTKIQAQAARTWLGRRVKKTVWTLHNCRGKCFLPLQKNGSGGLRRPAGRPFEKTRIGYT